MAEASGSPPVSSPRSETTLGEKQSLRDYGHADQLDYGGGVE